MSVFTKAKDKVASSKLQPSKKATVWQVADANEATALNSAIHEIVKHAEDCYLRAYADRGVAPDSPMQLVNNDGEKVIYVVQERCAQSKVKDEQVEQLDLLLGEDAAKAILFENSVFKFNNTLLAKDGVMDAVGSALESAFEGLVESGCLTAAEASNVLEVDEFVAFKPGTTNRLADVCGRDTQKMKNLLDVMGSASARYVKAS